MIRALTIPEIANPYSAYFEFNQSFKLLLSIDIRIQYHILVGLEN
jgi:uncharacterized radical SAM superfamily protein